MKMGARDKYEITFDYLERELHKAIREDEDYKLRNDAKFRAVYQNAATYKEFKDIVDAAHLQPLKKPEKNVTPKIGKPWNLVSSQMKPNFEITFNEKHNKKTAVKTPRTSHEFLQMWTKRCPTDLERFQLIKNMASNERVEFLTSETMSCRLAEILSALLEMQNIVEDIQLSINILIALSNTKRFRLSVIFLSETEKTKCQTLFKLLKNAILQNEKIMLEISIHKNTLEDLQQKYDVANMIQL